MTRKEFITDIEKTYKVALEILKKKNQDYATELNPFANFDKSIIVGVEPTRAILVRVMDKISRISILLSKDPSVVDESIMDSICDTINYMAILKAKLKK